MAYKKPCLHTDQMLHLLEKLTDTVASQRYLGPAGEREGSPNNWSPPSPPVSTKFRPSGAPIRTYAVTSANRWYPPGSMLHVKWIASVRAIEAVHFEVAEYCDGGRTVYLFTAGGVEYIHRDRINESYLYTLDRRVFEETPWEIVEVYTNCRGDPTTVMFRPHTRSISDHRSFSFTVNV